MTLPILTVDLTTKKIGQKVIPSKWAEDFVGGSSLAARLLYEHITPELDPLSSEAPLLFLTGPLSGTAGPSVGRFVVCALSPLTGLWGESNCGGFWGVELRKAGFDGIFFTGASKNPVYLWVNNGQAEIRSAQHLWGRDTYQTQEDLKTDLNHKNVRIASIGLSGESQIPLSLILTDHGRVAGRSGMGAVMGSKKLKAVAVKGNGPIPLADPLSFARLRSEANRSMRDDNVTRGLKELGTAAIADYLDYLGEMPKRGFTRGEMEGATNVSGAMVAETILVGVKACHACVIACGREVRLDDGAKRKGPEYETLVGFGPNLWLDDAATATRLGELCDRYGMDVISVSGTIAFAILLFEEGYITEFDTDGITLKWGDPELIEQLVHMMAKSEGFGAFLAEGSRGLGKRFNRAERAVQVNGLEVPYHDPRGASGMGLVYATSPRGACHMQSDYFRVEIGKVESELGLEFFDRHGGSEKSANVAIHQNWTTLFNALVMCVFTNVAPQVVIDLINAATGLNWTIEDALIAGERAWNLKRVINNRLGLKRSNDKLPDPLLEPFPDGGSANFVIEFDEMLEVYYQARGWDWETGYPKREKLISLGLDWLVNDLYPEDG